MAGVKEGGETLVADVSDVERTTATSLGVALGGIWESGACCVLGEEQRVGAVLDVDGEDCSWAEGAG